MQHLKPVEPPEDGSARLRCARLQQLDRSISQNGGWDMTQGRDGEVYLMPITLPHHQAEVDAFDAIKPVSTLSTTGMSNEQLDQLSTRYMRNIEGAEMGMAPLSIERPTNGSEGDKNIQAVGLLAGMVQPPFSITWLGENQWKVNGGRFGYPRIIAKDPDTGDLTTFPRSTFIEGVTVTTEAGFILFPVTFTPDNSDLTGYEAVPGKIETLPTFTQNAPARQMLAHTEDSISVNWQPGIVYAPLAWVEALPWPRIIYLCGGHDIQCSGNGVYGPGPPSFLS